MITDMITDPKQMPTYSCPEQIAEVVYEAATDGKKPLRYLAGDDAKAIFASRPQIGDQSSARRLLSSSLGIREHWGEGDDGPHFLS
jgi:hypothetical protein